MKKFLNRGWLLNIEICIAIFFIFFSIAASYLFFDYLNNFHSNSLRNNLVTIAKTAVLQINSATVDKIQTASDINKPEFNELVSYLKAIRKNNPDISYVYIMRKSDDPNTLLFVADADALSSKEELDINHNNIIESWEEISMPGDEYDITSIPSMKEAFFHATADKAITVDKWGELISGYAPIYNEKGEAIAILGVDLKATDYYKMQNRTQMGLFILVTVFSLITVIIFLLIRQYQREIKFLKNLDLQKSDFISLASHQLRTPLSASKWCVHMLKQGDYGHIDEERKKVINDLCLVNERMINLVNDLLKVSQVDSYKLQAKFISINVEELCKKVISEINYLLKEKQIKFTFQYKIQQTHLLTDADLLKEVLFNLLSNAIKYTPVNKKIELIISEDKNKIFFTIKDEGYGIPRDEQDRLFTKFFRASNILRKDPSGTGLGLYFVKKVVDLLGGKITCKSEENKGTEFCVILPINH